jgi:sulfate transport system substrate-binding protein
MVFLVRKGNPKNIRDWDDCIKDGVEVITPDPKSSGGACWNFLAAMSYAQYKYSDESSVENFLRKLYNNVSVLDSGARGSTTTFVENGKGDVLIAWENEAISVVKNYPGQYEIVSPSVSIEAQPSVAIVDDNVRMNGTELVSQRYIEFLYTESAQRLAAENGYRPTNESVLEEYSNVFDMSIKLTTIDDFGGWDNAYKLYFDDGGLFDKIYNE